jgi:pyruvate dehydrogenase E1 component alpha subunit
MQRDNGLMRGKGGSMHLTSAEHGVMGSYAIIGAHLPIACGAAWRAQYKGAKDVSVCFFGDGTTNIGAFHEALNFAAVWKLPVIFVCENNLYMEYTPIGEVTAVPQPAADRASAYGLERIVIDGNDADVVYRTAQAAYDKARAGDGPSLIECLTYRHSGHSRADPAKYRPEGELDRWKQCDPIKIYRERLLQFGVSEKTIGEIDAEVRKMVDDATEACKAAPPPPLDIIATDVYADGGWAWRNDVPRRRHSRHRPGDASRSRRRVSRRRRGQGRWRVQGDRGPLRAVRPVARARHADFRTGDPRCRDGRRDDGAEADSRDHVL